MTLTEYFTARDIWTGETFAEYCDRSGISFESAMFGYERGRLIQQLIDERAAKTATSSTAPAATPAGPIPV